MRIEPGLRPVSRNFLPTAFPLDLPRFGERLASSDDETSSNSTSDGNHSDVPRLEATVQMRMIAVQHGAVIVGVEFASTDDASVVCVLLAILGI
jgi:hypothetical protein